MAAFGLGIASNSNSTASPQQTAAPAATTTVTSTTTSTEQATATTTVTAKPSVQKVITVVQANDQAVQDVLNAWQAAGPKPDQQAAAMVKLRREWPTLAKALEAATGVKAPATTRTRSTTTTSSTPTTRSKPTPRPTSPPKVYYANCTAVRAAGAAPLYAGQPGYRPGLDRDGDGVACE